MPELRKILKNYGKATIIRFSPEELEIHNAEAGDIMLIKDFEIIKLEDIKKGRY